MNDCFLFTDNIQKSNKEFIETHMDKKIIATAVVIVAIVIIAGVFVMRKRSKMQNLDQLTQNDNPSAVDMSDWKTYRNDDYGFEIKYPSEYLAKLGDKHVTFDPTFFISNPRIPEATNMNTNYVLELNITRNFLWMDNIDGVIVKNPDEWFADQKEQTDNYVKTTIAGQLAFAKDDKWGEIETKQYAVFIKNELSYDLYQFIIRKDDVGEKIISTVKFTKSRIVTAPAI